MYDLTIMPTARLTHALKTQTGDTITVTIPGQPKAITISRTSAEYVTHLKSSGTAYAD